MVEDSTHLPEIGRTAADDDGNDEEDFFRYIKSPTP